VVAYQGEVVVDDEPYTGDGYFKFTLTNEAGNGTYWSNDGSGAGGHEPTAAVRLTVSEGLFSVLLGDTSLDGMGYALSADVFSQPNRYLRVWFSTSAAGPFHLLEPDTRIAAVPYALQAQEAVDSDTVDGFEGGALEESAEVDADVAAHAAVSDAHHARYTDGEAWAAALANDGASSGLDADTVDGQQAATLEESAEIDVDVAAHAAVSDAHHERYTDGEAWAAALANDGTGSGLDADTVDGLHASELGTHYQNVVVVAKSGGDYASVQAAIDSVTDAAAGNPYLVWVAPGVYSETVTMKPYVHLQGAGQEATIITSTCGSTTWPLAEGTVRLASDVSLRDLTVGNGGSSSSHVALVATAGTTRTLVAKVAARVVGAGENHIAIRLSGNGTGVTLESVTALAEHGGNLNFGLINMIGARATLHGGSFAGRGGEAAYGIMTFDTGTMLEAVNVTALAENGDDLNHGLVNRSGSVANLSGGSFTGRGGTDGSLGIENEDPGTTMVAQGVNALGESDSGYNYGLDNQNAATVTLCCGSFVGRGGSQSYGIHNDGDATLGAEGVTALAEGATGGNHGLNNGDGAEAGLRGGSYTGRGGSGAEGIHSQDATLEAVSVTALGESGDYNNGLYSYNGAATLRGGAFTGRGGATATGIACLGVNTSTLEAESVTALGEDGENHNYGLSSATNSTAVLRGGSFTGRGKGTGTNRGIRNAGVLEAVGVAALGEGGDVESYGLYNFTGAEATLRRSSFTGRDGTYAHGILNFTATLRANGITALAEDGTSTNDGLTNSGGSVMINSSQLTGSSNGFEQWSGTTYLGVSQLDGGATKTAGTLTCFQVYDQAYTAYACP
jgi:hypothetical protein